MEKITTRKTAIKTANAVRNEKYNTNCNIAHAANCSPSEFASSQLSSNNTIYSLIYDLHDTYMKNNKKRSLCASRGRHKDKSINKGGLEQHRTRESGQNAQGEYVGYSFKGEPSSR